jgi:hypothetical protein
MAVVVFSSVFMITFAHHKSSCAKVCISAKVTVLL